MEKDGPGWEWQENKRPQDTTMYGQLCGNTCQMHPNVKKTQKWAFEKPKLDNERRLRGTCFIEPDDEEFKRIMKNARGQLEIPMPATPTTLRYIDVVRRTSTTLAVLLDSRVDDYSNVNGDRNSSELWTGFMQFTILSEKHPDGFTWPGGRLTKIQATPRPDHSMSRNFVRMSRAAERREKQQWTIEKPKLDNARQLRGIYFCDSEDAEVKDTLKNARKKLELPMDSAMPCKVKNHQCREPCGKESDTRRSKHACIVEAHESARKCWERALLKEHEDRIVGKGFKSLRHHSLVHMFFLCPKQRKYQMQKAAVDKELEKLEKLPAWQNCQREAQKE